MHDNIVLTRVTRALAPLKNHVVDDAALGRLSRFLAAAEAHELYQANPRHWAERAGLDERDMLTLVIAGVEAGLFDLEWRVTCPSCGKAIRTAQVVKGILSSDYCEDCRHSFEAHLDEEVAATVSVSSAVRQLALTARDDPAFRAEVDQRLGRVTALSLINVPSFSELTAQQILPEGQSLGVKRLALFFSDLRGSTSFYRRRGDAEAYRWVADHFQIIFAAAAAHGGTAVKTIGDGVMGVFGDPLDALRAAAEAVKGLNALNNQAQLAGDDRLQLKVGLHVGPCIVVTLNRRLDYFGETVNIAARLADLSVGDEVIVSHAVVQDEAACRLADDLGALEPMSAQLRGLPDTFELHRLRLAA
jgi:class 3 adenylate cyclase